MTPRAAPLTSPPWLLVARGKHATPGPAHVATLAREASKYQGCPQRPPCGYPGNCTRARQHLPRRLHQEHACLSMERQHMFHATTGRQGFPLQQCHSEVAGVATTVARQCSHSLCSSSCVTKKASTNQGRCMQPVPRPATRPLSTRSGQGGAQITRPSASCPVVSSWLSVFLLQCYLCIQCPAGSDCLHMTPRSHGALPAWVRAVPWCLRPRFPGRAVDAPPPSRADHAPGPAVCMHPPEPAAPPQGPDWQVCRPWGSAGHEPQCWTA